MYDDNPGDYPGDDRDRTVHLCPDCRDLMGSVVALARRLPEPAPEPDWSRALRWLDALCGGREAVLALDAVPLAGEIEPTAGLAAELPAEERADRLQRLESCLTLLDATARRFFEEEAGVAFARALLRVHEREPGVVTGARSATLLALGVVWAVGHANGLLYPRGVVTEKELKGYLNVNQSGSTVGYQVRDALVGPYTWQSERQPWGYRMPSSSRELEPLGHADLLVSATRRQLIAVRDRALADRERVPAWSC